MLVAYASRFGSTKGVAERIAATLAESGVPAVSRPVVEVEDVEPYHAVVLGSAVFSQRWMPEAEELVRTRGASLAERPLWLFSVGTFGDTKRLIGPLMRREPKGIEEVVGELHPRGYRVFAGVIDRHQWPFVSRIFYHALGGRLGDNRDWDEIEAWAREIAAAMSVRTTAPAAIAR